MIQLLKIHTQNNVSSMTYPPNWTVSTYDLPFIPSLPTKREIEKENKTKICKQWNDVKNAMLILIGMFVLYCVSSCPHLIVETFWRKTEGERKAQKSINPITLKKRNLSYKFGAWSRLIIWFAHAWRQRDHILPFQATDLLLWYMCLSWTDFSIFILSLNELPA